jgi:hypothetical protein
MEIEEYINKIIDNNKKEDMEKLSDMLEDILCKIKEYDYDKYKCYKMKLYELAVGKKLNEDMAMNWVKSMTPVGLYWTIDETTNAMHQMGYNCNEIDFFISANMMMNDYRDITKDNEELALKMAYDFLNDEDAVENKLYEYWKHIPKK